MRRIPHLIACAVLLSTAVCLAATKETSCLVGLGRVDVTPNYPVRLAGYAARSTEATNVAQRIFANAIAFGSDRQKARVLLTVDNCGVPLTVRNEVVSALKREDNILPENVAVCSSHTHSAPLLHGYLTNLFLGPLPADQDERVRRYTAELTHSLVRAAKQALADRRPATLGFGKGSATFAANRRTPGGPVDHDVPVLCVKWPSGLIRAVLVNYACHCTTLTGEFNSVSGDWAGFAQAAIEREFPGSLCLVAIGCGGDANPHPRPGADLAERHGNEIAAAVKAVLEGPLVPVPGAPESRTRNIQLPYDKLPTRLEWEEKLKDSPYVAQHARINLARLDRGEALPTSLDYMVQTWIFGKSLAMVFLPGEVTVDYSLRLKRELDASRTWVNAYANDVPCYIPSERVLREGGYEGGFAMVYYDRPTRFAAGVEDTIIQTVRALIPGSFAVRTKRGAQDDPFAGNQAQ